MFCYYSLDWNSCCSESIQSPNFIILSTHTATYQVVNLASHTPQILILNLTTAHSPQTHTCHYQPTHNHQNTFSPFSQAYSPTHQPTLFTTFFTGPVGMWAGMKLVGLTAIAGASIGTLAGSWLKSKELKETAELEQLNETSSFAPLLPKQGEAVSAAAAAAVPDSASKKRAWVETVRTNLFGGFRFAAEVWFDFPQIEFCFLFGFFSYVCVHFVIFCLALFFCQTWLLQDCKWS